jgi:hypothetical protein
LQKVFKLLSVYDINIQVCGCSHHQRLIFVFHGPKGDTTIGITHGEEMPSWVNSYRSDGRPPMFEHFLGDYESTIDCCWNVPTHRLVISSPSWCTSRDYKFVRP